MTLVAAHDAGSASHLFRLIFESTVRYFSSGPASDIARDLGKESSSIDALLRILDDPSIDEPVVVGTGLSTVEKEVIRRSLKSGKTTIAYFDSVTNLRQRLEYQTNFLRPTFAWTQDPEIAKRLSIELPELRTVVKPNHMLEELLLLKRSLSSSGNARTALVIGDPRLTDAIRLGDKSVLLSFFDSYFEKYDKLVYRPHPIETRRDANFVLEFLSVIGPSCEFSTEASPLFDIAASERVVGNSSYLLRLAQLAGMPVAIVTLERADIAYFGEDYSRFIRKVAVPTN